MATPLSIVVGLVSFLVLVFAVVFALAGGEGVYFCALAGACALAGVVLGSARTGPRAGARLASATAGAGRSGRPRLRTWRFRPTIRPRARGM